MAAGQLRLIKRRIRSIQNTAKITRAMELVAASKMRRAQLNAVASRPYAERMRWVLADLAETLHQYEPQDLHPLLRERDEVRNIEVIFITPTRGLCGGLPGNLNRRIAQFTIEHGKPQRVVAVGRKGRDVIRRSGQQVIAEFLELGDYPSYENVQPIARIAIDDFVNGEADEVYVAYGKFMNMVTQAPTVERILPIVPETESATEAIDYIYEPGREAVLAELLPRVVGREIYAAVLEAAASEQSAHGGDEERL
jgi:F-type H+-transporting ATPase subunit gamma